MRNVTASEFSRIWLAWPLNVWLSMHSEILILPVLDSSVATYCTMFSLSLSPSPTGAAAVVNPSWWALPFDEAVRADAEAQRAALQLAATAAKKSAAELRHGLRWSETAGQGN